MAIDPRVRDAAGRQPYPLLFATLSGAHLYGFPSADSDYDVRGSHILPARECLGLTAPRETIEVAEERDGVELDVVTHDVRKFFSMLLARNGYVLEQLHSPLVVATSPEHRETRELARRCVTRAHSHHYLGFAQSQWKLLLKKPRVKQALYLYRVLFTGIHLMRTGEVQANLIRLNEEFKSPHVPELVERKLGGKEKGKLDESEIPTHEREYTRLCRVLEDAARTSALPEEPPPAVRAGLNALLLRLRLRSHRE